MPNKYSHSVVLAHYSSLGLIDLPNDQYIAYLKNYPTSTRTSVASRSQVHSTRTQGSVTPSTAHSGRYRILEDHAATPRSITDRKEYEGSMRRNVIMESDEGSGDERVILHRKYEPIDAAPQTQQNLERHGLRTEKRRLPSVSTYTGRSSSEVSERAVPTHTQQQVPSRVKGEPKTSPPSVINLNDYEAGPAQQSDFIQPAEAWAPPSSGLKVDHPAGQVKSVNGRTASSSSSSSFTQGTRIYNPNPRDKPDFDGFSDTHLSEVTITGINNADQNGSPPVPRSQFSNFSFSNQPMSSSSNQPISSSSKIAAADPKRMDSATGLNRNPLRQKKPRHKHSFDSISSINSEDMAHVTTALPPVVPPKSQKPVSAKPVKRSLASRDTTVNDDTIDPNFFETLRGGPPRSFNSQTTQRHADLEPNLPPPVSRRSMQHSRHSADHATPNPDFWRGLEEMLSDSDASVVFPPDIAKSKPRDGDYVPAPKLERHLRNGTEDGYLKRPTTAPAAKTSSHHAFAATEPLPDGRSRITVTNRASLDRTRDARQLTTVQLVDTSTPKKLKKGFFRRLRKSERK